MNYVLPPIDRPVKNNGNFLPYIASTKFTNYLESYRCNSMLSMNPLIPSLFPKPLWSNANTTNPSSANALAKWTPWLLWELRPWN